MRILVFAPHSEIWVHAFPEAIIADALRAGGHEIKYVTCGGVFSDFCVPMSAHKLTVESNVEERLEICRLCNRNAGLLKGSFGFETSSIADDLSSQDRVDMDDLLATTPNEALESLSLDGVPVGRIALYQVLLRSKRFDTKFEAPEWAQYRNDLRHTLYVARAAKKIFDRWRPQRVLVYNGLYSVNRAVCLLAEAREIPSYFMHAGLNFSKRLQSVMLGAGQTFSYLRRVISQWPRFANIPCSTAQLERVTDHLAELLRGRSIFAYSANKSHEYFDAKAFFRVGRDQKLIVATLSSHDEDAAGILTGAKEYVKGLLFRSQVEWVSALLEFVKVRPDIFLIIRVHPREFPNRRDQRMSQHAGELQSALAHMPDNATVNWPDQNISIYDLADQADVFLNAWSSAGKDMSMLGIPVVIYSSRLPWYTPDLNYLGEDRESYFSAIDKALKEGWSFERARLAYRWLVYEFVRSTIDISDSYFEVENPNRTLMQKVYYRLMRKFDPTYVQRRDIRARTSRLKAAQQVNRLIESGHSTLLEQISDPSVGGASLEEETAALRNQLCRLADLLFVTPAARAKSRLYKNMIGVAS